MDNKNWEDTKKTDEQWDENDILNDDMFNISNMSNMISMSSMSNMYMPSMPTIVNINSGDTLEESREEKSFLNKK
jgi:hypothetical protein